MRNHSTFALRTSTRHASLLPPLVHGCTALSHMGSQITLALALPPSHSLVSIMSLAAPSRGGVRLLWSSLGQLCCHHRCSLSQSSARRRSHAVPFLRHSSTVSSVARQLPEDGKTLAHFVSASIHPATSASPQPAPTPPLPTLHTVDDEQPSATDTTATPVHPSRPTYYIETYGCAMNSSDSEIVESVLQAAGMRRVDDVSQASLIAVNTCAIRDNAEAKIWQRLHVFRSLRYPTPQKVDRTRHGYVTRSQYWQPAFDQSARPLVAVLGCMAERLKDKLLDEQQLVDIVVGPDAYRDLPRLIDAIDVAGHANAMNVQLAVDETYADITPVRAGGSATSAYVSIMRGCDNLCSYCIVPFTRGRERSRDASSIANEVRSLLDAGYKEVTLLGQNVNSYNWTSERTLAPTKQAKTAGFVNISRRPLSQYDFTQLLDTLSLLSPELRFRFTSPHPKDVPTELLQLMRERHTLCKSIHLPAQSGSTSVLQRMRRGYGREAYEQLIADVRQLLPSATISTDMIAGFCGETEDEHRASVQLMEQVQFDQAFMFHYSQREKTHAHRTMADDVAESVKLRRLQEIIDAFQAGVKQRNAELLGSVQLVLIEGRARRSPDDWMGRTDGNRIAVLPSGRFGKYGSPGGLAVDEREVGVGDYVAVEVLRCTSMSFVCRPLGWTTQAEYYALHSNANMERRVEPLVWQRHDARGMHLSASAMTNAFNAEHPAGHRFEATGM